MNHASKLGSQKASKNEKKKIDEYLKNKERNVIQHVYIPADKFQGNKTKSRPVQDNWTLRKFSVEAEPEWNRKKTRWWLAVYLILLR